MKRIIVAFLFFTVALPIFAQEKSQAYKKVKMTICDEKMTGCAERLIIKDKSYLIEATTNAINIKYLNIVSGLRDQNKLETTLPYIKGYIKKQKGHFPNPMADFEVFHLVDLKTPEEK